MLLSLQTRVNCRSRVHCQLIASHVSIVSLKLTFFLTKWMSLVKSFKLSVLWSRLSFAPRSEMDVQFMASGHNDWWDVLNAIALWKTNVLYLTAIWTVVISDKDQHLASPYSVQTRWREFGHQLGERSSTHLSWPRWIEFEIQDMVETTSYPRWISSAVFRNIQKKIKTIDWFGSFRKAVGIPHPLFTK